jgi:hypothetical protein
MTTTTATNKLDIVREVIEVIDECIEDGMEMCISMQVCMYLKDTYGYDRAEASEMLVGAQLIHELGLLK